MPKKKSTHIFMSVLGDNVEEYKTAVGLLLFRLEELLRSFPGILTRQKGK